MSHYESKIVKHKLREIVSNLTNESRMAFPGSEEYWNNRYITGGNSGPGSFNILAAFKAEIINHFVKENNITTVIEFGCGDGNQLKLSNYPVYIGFDVSIKSIEICRNIYRNSPNKSFILVKDYSGEKAELTLSLDVIFHLIEDDVFHRYMQLLFDASERYVIIYSSNTDFNLVYQAPHVFHRNFTKWINKRLRGWKLISYIPNRYPHLGDDNTGSFADFYIFEKIGI
ncbi:MAG: hypothetical protein QG635_1586 [Bacteroidota bacterium]|nr:hypothetical protein [Bacteroidota bacterium]